MSLSAAPWGRGTGEGIGLSGHKNEYKSGVRISNWVEEQFGQEAAQPGAATRMMEFTKRQEESQIASGSNASETARTMRIEPKMGVPGALLFSHGRTQGEKYGAAMSALHYTDPASRTYGPTSNDRVHKSFFYGSKHIDVYVPKTSPNPRMTLTAQKQAQWGAQIAPTAPTGPDMYTTSSQIIYKK